MSQFVMVLHYGGTWIDSQYTGGRSKTMLVSDTITYQGLVSKLHHRIIVHPDHYAMKVHYQYKSNLGMCSMMEIMDDEDLASWVCESLSVQPNKIPLYITLERNMSSSATGSNQGISSSIHNDDVVSAIPSREEGIFSHSEWDNVEFSADPPSNVQDNESPIDGTCGDIAANSIPSSSHRSKSKSIQDSDIVKCIFLQQGTGLPSIGKPLIL